MVRLFVSRVLFSAFTVLITHAFVYGVHGCYFPMAVNRFVLVLRRLLRNPLGI